MIAKVPIDTGILCVFSFFDTLIELSSITTILRKNIVHISMDAGEYLFQHLARNTVPPCQRRQAVDPRSFDVVFHDSQIEVLDGFIRHWGIVT